MLARTGAWGVMVGRHAIRNPWIFSQIRDVAAGRSPRRVTLADVRGYVDVLYGATLKAGVPESVHVNKMKKYLNFVGQGIDPAGAFLSDMRRSATERELFEACDRHMLAEPGRIFPDEPLPGLVARPNCETAEPAPCSLDTITG